MIAIPKGSKVKVSFQSKSATNFSGQQIEGFGIVDRSEDGYVFGRLDNGQTFMCSVSDVFVIGNETLVFEKWFMDQDFYTNMRFIHGDNLFSKDGGVYRVLPVRMTHLAFCKSTQSLNNIESCYIEMKQENNQLKAILYELNSLAESVGNESSDDLKCWSCDKKFTINQHASNDGFCVHCDAEVEVG